jgi:hypothetical protein
MMHVRFSRSVVTFVNPFVISGYAQGFPAGDYEVVAEEEVLQGLTFVSYRRTATYLTHCGRLGAAQPDSLQAITEFDLETALSRDRTPARRSHDSEAALFPSEEQT